MMKLNRIHNVLFIFLVVFVFCNTFVICIFQLYLKLKLSKGILSNYYQFTIIYMFRLYFLSSIPYDPACCKKIST